MKALLRAFNGQEYVWETVKFNNGRFRINGMTLSETDIVSIVNDNRKNYIQCSSCGQTFGKATDHFEKHKQESATTTPCLTCPHLDVSNRHVQNRRFVMNDDGTFTEKTKSFVELKCCNVGMWSHPSILSDNAKAQCAKRNCENAVAQEIHDTFTDYPGLFDEIITADSIEMVGYKEKHHYGHETEYILKGRNKIEAYVNKLGIVVQFTVYYYDDYWCVVYSKKYDKLFTFGDRGKYEEFNPWQIPEDSYNRIKNRIAELYN